jgi:hypothetical protein
MDAEMSDSAESFLADPPDLLRRSSAAAGGRPGCTGVPAAPSASHPAGVSANLPENRARIL